MEMDNMKQIIQELLGGMEERINANKKKAEASMAKLLEDKMDAKMDSYQKKAEARMAKLLKDKMGAKIDSYQE
jgi:hypothetical protein